MEEDDEQKQTAATVAGLSDRKLRRKIKKAKKIITEFELARSNDSIKRPGELLDSPASQKKVKEEVAAATKATSDEKKLHLNPEEFKELKKQLMLRKKFLKNLPRFSLQYSGMTASLSIPQDKRVPILVSDVQQLLLYALGGNTVCHPPERWCLLEKYNQLTHIVVLILEGLSCQDFFSNEHLLPIVTSVFPERVEVLSPLQYGNDVAQEMACVPLSQTQKQNMLKKYGSLEAALHSKEVFKVFRAIFPINFSEAEDDLDESITILSSNPTPLLPPEDLFPRTYLLLSLQQMVLEDYPLPFEFEMTTKYSSYKMTKKKYKEVSMSSPMFALDCEMCLTDKNLSELTRIALVDEHHQVLYESLVKPKNKITNYLTEFSGITKKLLSDVTTTLEDVQKALRERLPEDAILVGHSLNCDLHALKMIHPYVIDTSVVFNMSGIRNKKAKLSFLVEHFLGDSIQQNGGHCPIEDATGAIKLVQLKLSKGFRFGDALTVGDDSLSIPDCQLTASIFNQTSKANKGVTIIAAESILEKYKAFSFGSKPESFVPIKIRKTKEAIERLQEASLNNNISMAHLDLSKKMKNSSLEDVMTEVDTMCESIFSHVSKNGMFVMLFTGAKANPKLPVIESDSDKMDSTENGDTSTGNNENGDTSTGNNEDGDTTTGNNEKGDTCAGNNDSVASISTNSISQNQRRLNLRTHHNGVCFIRINSPK